MLLFSNFVINFFSKYILSTAESAEALLSFKNGGFKVKRELDFGDDSDQGNQMTLGPEMFGLKRITDMSAAPNKTNAITSTVALNRRGIVSFFFK